MRDIAGIRINHSESSPTLLPKHTHQHLRSICTLVSHPVHWIPLYPTLGTLTSQLLPTPRNPRTPRVTATRVLLARQWSCAAGVLVAIQPLSFLIDIQLFFLSPECFQKNGLQHQKINQVYLKLTVVLQRGESLKFASKKINSLHSMEDIIDKMRALS